LILHIYFTYSQIFCIFTCLENREKTVEILSLSADIARLMNGARLTSCKSAKDRTSMSLTWEQARILSDNHRLPSDEFGVAMSVMRSAGVRRENAYKNIGKNKFAFNSLQLKMIPDIYRAPRGSGGAEVT
jgi:inositol polyphosphate-4-phosphatase